MMTTYSPQLLIGGPRDGRLVSIPDSARDWIVQTAEPLRLVPRQQPADTAEFTTTVYTRRVIQTHDGAVEFFAAANLSDYEMILQLRDRYVGVGR